MKRPPLILLGPSTQKRGVEFEDNSVNISNQYSMAVAAAGGLPSIAACIPSRALVANAVDQCDGVLMSGGDDIQPELYAPKLGPKLRKTVSGTEPERDAFELLLIDEVFRQRKPLFAICRGHQMMNVAFGGTLIVDIPSELPGALDHRQMARKNEVVHEVALTPGSLLSNTLRQTKLGVNSSHHQAVGRVAEPLRVTARSSDGVIEAMELQPGAADLLPFFLAVQFHPERLFARHAEHLKLFREFVRACVIGKKV